MPTPKLREKIHGCVSKDVIIRSKPKRKQIYWLKSKYLERAK